MRERWPSSRLCAPDHPNRQLADSLVSVARMPAFSVCRYQALLQGASRHLTRGSSKGDFAGQLRAPQCVNTHKAYNLAQVCEGESRKDTQQHPHLFSCLILCICFAASSFAIAKRAGKNKSLIRPSILLDRFFFCSLDCVLVDKFV